MTTKLSPKTTKVIVYAAIAIGAVIGLTATQNRTTTYTPSDVQELLISGAPTESLGALYGQLETQFPTEYQGFLTEIATQASQKNAGGLSQEMMFQKGQSFSAQLRQDNAHYVTQAPIEQIRAINESATALLVSLQDDPATCAQMALMGGASFTSEQTMKLDPELIAASAAANFQAMADGRDNPTSYPEATNDEISAVFQKWSQQDDVTEAMVNAVATADINSPDQCAANISFANFVSTDTDPKTEAVMVRLVALSLGL